MRSVLDPRLSAVMATYLRDTVEVWRPTQTAGAGSGRVATWLLVARVQANVQPIPRLPRDEAVAAQMGVVVEWNIYVPRDTAVEVGDVVRWGVSSQTVGATVAAAVFAALPGKPLRIEDEGGESNMLLRQLVAREVTA